MAAWILVPCLDRLRDDLDAVAPGRDHATDGAIGDANHSSTSDHTPDEISDALRNKDADSRNEVHAVDLDVDLRVPGLTMEKVVQHILGRCRSGAERRLRYIIFNRRIWEASNGWRQRAYSGDNAHDKHAHFSSSYDTALEANTSSWRLEDIPVALTDADKTWLTAQIDRAATAAAERVWKTKFDIETGQDKVYIAEAGSILLNIPGEHARVERTVTATKDAVDALDLSGAGGGASVTEILDGMAQRLAS